MDKKLLALVGISATILVGVTTGVMSYMGSIHAVKSQARINAAIDVYTDFLALAARENFASQSERANLAATKRKATALIILHGTDEVVEELTKLDGPVCKDDQLVNLLIAMRVQVQENRPRPEFAGHAHRILCGD